VYCDIEFHPVQISLMIWLTSEGYHSAEYELSRQRDSQCDLHSVPIRVRHLFCEAVPFLIVVCLAGSQLVSVKDVRGVQLLAITITQSSRVILDIASVVVVFQAALVS